MRCFPSEVKAPGQASRCGQRKPRRAETRRTGPEGAERRRSADSGRWADALGRKQSWFRLST